MVTDEPGTLCQAGVLIKRGTEQMLFHMFLYPSSMLRTVLDWIALNRPLLRIYHP